MKVEPILLDIAFEPTRISDLSDMNITQIVAAIACVAVLVVGVSLGYVLIKKFKDKHDEK